MLLPKRVKYRKQHRGRRRGRAKGGTEVHFGDYGLLGRYPGVDGMKTGFICPSGFNVVASASRGGQARGSGTAKPQLDVSR